MKKRKRLVLAVAALGFTFCVCLGLVAIVTQDTEQQAKAPPETEQVAFRDTQAPPPTPTDTPPPTPLPTDTLVPTLPPTAMSSPTPVPYASGGLGLSRSEWERVHGAGTAADFGVEYEQGRYIVQFQDDRVWYIERQWSSPVLLEDAQAQGVQLIPHDSQLVQSYSPENLPELVVDLYQSDSLAPLFANWAGGSAGRLEVVCGVLPDGVGRMVISIGNSYEIPAAEAQVEPAATLPPAEPSGAAHVLRVIDGDTIEVEIDGQPYRVRYIGMDTPEQGMPFYQEATQANAALVADQDVSLEKDVSETDRYGRLLRYVYVGETMVNEELLRQGYAQVATYPPDVSYQDRFLAVQQEAQTSGLGLWGGVVTAPEPVENTPEPTAAGVQAQVVIQHIFFDGLVSRVESDEYAEIANVGAAPVDIGGWLLNAGDPGQNFTFPGYVLQPGQTCRVYTNESHPESGGFSFGSGRAIWNNKGDCGFLYDASGQAMSEYCY
jgi:endonuclease YncB( thermonuclease family)